MAAKKTFKSLIAKKPEPVAVEEHTKVEEPKVEEVTEVIEEPEIEEIKISTDKKIYTVSELARLSRDEFLKAKAEVDEGKAIAINDDEVDQYK